MGGGASSRRRAQSRSATEALSHLLEMAEQGHERQSSRYPPRAFTGTRLVCHSCSRSFTRSEIDPSDVVQCPSCGGTFIEYQVSLLFSISVDSFVLTLAFSDTVFVRTQLSSFYLCAAGTAREALAELPRYGFDCSQRFTSNGADFSDDKKIS
jgi:hypothetical protein